MTIHRPGSRDSGFGSGQVTGQDATDGVRNALEIGYRHIDTARAGENEAALGARLTAGGLDRTRSG